MYIFNKSGPSNKFTTIDFVIITAIDTFIMFIKNFNNFDII